MNETVVLKKYANRRLYDTEKSAYVTLEQVAEMIRGGRQIRVLDAKTNRSAFAYARALTSNGVYVTVGGSISRLLQVLVLAPLIRIFQKKYLRIVALKTNKDLAYMNDLFEKGKIKAVIDGPYRLEQLPDAFRIFAKADHKGKIVITM